MRYRNALSSIEAPKDAHLERARQLQGLIRGRD